ncbi:proteasome-type protease [Andreprevotia chitinilytica]|uniref:proteasome-type protease n=1 Tax=Andreprevotia chitinilytica TaxID=396808 RepID=UPI00054E8FF9|nr:proteasome-type protease [Andreprevotia chitinilytica]
MTYCVAMALEQGLLFASDSRTNAGVDHISTFSKMHLFEVAGERQLVLLTAGNLATTQSVVSLLRQRWAHDGIGLRGVSSLYDAALLIGDTVREVIARDVSEQGTTQGIDYGASFLLGGQIKGEQPRLFNIYPQGNFIESSVETPYFQIGESKYGKPILDRVVQFSTPLNEALKCTLISFDSTIRSNLSVGLPIDTLTCKRDAFVPPKPYRVTETDPYFNQIRKSWGRGLRKVFTQLPDGAWFER